MYQESIDKRGLKEGRHLTAHAGEYFSGLPLGWTTPVAGAVDVTTVKEQFPSGEVGLCSRFWCVYVHCRPTFLFFSTLGKSTQTDSDELCILDCVAHACR